MAMGHPTEIALDALKEAGRCIGLAAMAVTITIHVPLHEETGVSYTNTRGARRNNNQRGIYPPEQRHGVASAIFKVTK